MARNNIMSLGNTKRINLYFKTTETGQPINPDSVLLKIKDPSGSTTTNSAINQSTGWYYYDFYPSIVGKHTIRCYSTGTYASSDEIFINVQAQLVP